MKYSVKELLSKFNKAEIASILDSHDISYPENASKSDLAELLSDVDFGGEEKDPAQEPEPEVKDEPKAESKPNLALRDALAARRRDTTPISSFHTELERRSGHNLSVTFQEELKKRSKKVSR